MQVEAEPLLPIPVATEKRPDPRLALTIGVAGRIADPKDFGKPPLQLVDLDIAVSALKLHLLDWCELMRGGASALCCFVRLLAPVTSHCGLKHLLDSFCF